MNLDPLTRRPFLDYDVPPIAVGCAPLGDMPNTFDYSVPPEIAKATVRAALASPLNWLDTAASYGDGESERRIGKVLQELEGLPDGAFLDTKVGASPDGDYSAETVKRRFARSQELLGMERLEMVFLHDPEKVSFEEITAPDGPLAVLQGYREEGLIEHLGVAGGPIDLMIRYVETGIFDAVITHNRYTLLDQSADPLLDLCHVRNIPVLNAAPYGSGMLAKGPSLYPRYAYSRATDDMIDRARQLEAICSRHNVPLAAVALQFSMRDPRVTATIVGLSRPERIEQTIDLATGEIPDTCWDEVLEVATGSCSTG